LFFEPCGELRCKIAATSGFLCRILTQEFQEDQDFERTRKPENTKHFKQQVGFQATSQIRSFRNKPAACFDSAPVLIVPCFERAMGAGLGISPEQLLQGSICLANGNAPHLWRYLRFQNLTVAFFIIDWR